MSNETRPPVESIWGKAEFEAIFIAHHDGIFRHLYRIIGSVAEAEDLTQETFWRLYCQRFAVSRTHNIRAWLYRVATNLAYNVLRNQKRRQHREATAFYRLPSGVQEQDPVESVQRRCQQEVVREVLAGLPARQAQLLLLRHAGLSYRELAEALDISPASVGTMLARAEVAFKTAYRAAGHWAEGGEDNGM